MKKGLLMSFLFTSILAAAQQKINIKGLVLDEKKQPLSFSTISLLNSYDSSIVLSQYALENGSFEFENVDKKPYILKFSLIGYSQTFWNIIPKEEDKIDLGEITVKNYEKSLNEIIVLGNKEPIVVKKDTLEFDAGVLKPMQNDNLEDLLRKIPALEIDENGGIKTQNKVIKKLYIDGKEFFGNDPQLALKNLPAESIDKIQVVEKKTEQAEFSGIDDGEREMIINVTLKSTHKKGTFGFVSVAGFPPIKESESYYNLKTSTNRFGPSEQISLIGFLNNLNQQGFTPQDASNFSNLNKQSNGGNGGGASNSGSVNLPIVVGKKPGIVNSEGLGLNYNNQYAKKSSLQTSYFYSGSHTNLFRELTRESFIPGKIINTNQKYYQNRNNSNHRLNATINHQFNPKNSLKFITGLNTISGNTSSNSNSKINTNTNGLFTENNSIRNVLNQSEGQSFNNSLFLRHRFSLPRRTVSLNTVYNLNKDKNNDSTNTKNENLVKGQMVLRNINQLNFRTTSQINQRIQLAYSEPISKTVSLEGNYSYQQNINQSNFEAWDISNGFPTLNINLSNAYNNTFNFQQAGIKINNETKEKTFVFGLFYQKSVLESVLKRGTDNLLQRSFQNVLPSFRYSMRKNANKNNSKSKNNNLTFEYNTAVNEPSVRDLQPITVNNNPQNIFLGNPELKPEYVHRMLFNNNSFNPKTFKNMSFSGNFNYTQKAIGYAQKVSDSLVRTTQPVNLPFRWNANLGINYTFSASKQKNRLRFSINPRYLVSKANTQINGVSNLNSQNQWRGELKASYLTDKINFVFNTNYQKSFVQYSVNKEFNQTFSVLKSATEFRWKASKKFSITSDFDYTYYQSSRLKTNLKPIPILNFAVKQLILKDEKGELMFSIQDVFKRNIYLSQRSDENFFEIDRSNTLSRYLLLTFTYSVRNNKKKN